MPPEHKEAHRKSGQHRVALLRRKYLVERQMVPLPKSGFGFSEESREMGAFIQLLRRAGVESFEDDVKVDFISDKRGRWMEEPPERGLYVPEWVAQLWTAKLGQFEFTELLFELGSLPDPQQVAVAVAAMIAHNRGA